MKRTLSFLLPAAAMLLAACGGANDRPSFPDFQEMADPAAAFADWSAAGDTPCASFVTTDRRFGKSQLPDVEPRTACRLTAWRGERVSAQLLVWSAQPVERLVCTAGVLTSDEGRLPESAVRTRFVRYVMSDEFACGCCKRKPQDFAAVLTADMLDERPSMALEACTVRPVWITVDVPQDAAPGLYRTPVTVACDGDEQRLELAVEVTGRTLPAPSEWRYHLDLWQHPAAVARVEGTEMWSDAHFEALRPVMKPLADAGQKVVTATLNKDPWNNQCYDAYADMIVWTKGADGAWTYDYAAFDRWVEFMEGLGVDKQINCYSMLPWNNMLHYRDAATGEWVDVKAEPGQPAFDEMWRPFLADFVRHLEEKGWLAKTCIAMDERSPEQMEIAVAFLAEHAPQLGIALADNHDSYKRYPQLHDICVSARQEVAPEDIAARRAAGVGEPLNVIACENGIRATSQLREEVYKHLSTEEAAWCDTHVGFADCSVDRIVPPVRSENPIDVVVENFYEWNVEEKSFVGGAPHIEGMNLADNLLAYIERKLFTLNTGHAITAYLGRMKGLATIDESIADPAIFAIVKEAMQQSGQALVEKFGFDRDAHFKYIDKIIGRFKNPYLKDDVTRVGREPLRKLSSTDRLVKPMMTAREYGLPCDKLLLGIGAALHYNNPEDPQSVKMQELIAAKGLRQAVSEITSIPATDPVIEEIAAATAEVEKRIR